MANSEPGVRPLAAAQPRANGRRPVAPASRTEAQLRARVSELEAQLAEIARCLAAAELRAAEALAWRERVIALEAQAEVIKASRSWRVTAPIRSSAGRGRRLLGR